MTAPRLAHLVLTGGPCAGKTTALSHLTEALTARGWRVLTVPEAATLLIGGGLSDLGALADADRGAYLAVQHQLVTLQRDLRERFAGIAAALGAPKVLVLHDRGVADNAAYMSATELTDVLGRAGLDLPGAYELYDAVLHLRSAAVTAAGYDGSAYTRANNPARGEDAQAAAALDAATLDAWAGHPHLAVIGAHGSFADKLERTVAAALRLLGDPDPVEVERKFLLRHAPDLTHPVLAGATRVHIEQVYLPVTEAGEQRVRARTLAGVTSYTHATKTDIGGAARVEVETPIEEQTYRMLAALRDPATAVVRKVRHVFVHGDQRFELDQVLEPAPAWLLEAELVADDDAVDLPAFLPPAREVTDDPAWRNAALARTASAG